jgi:hypothetical protein
LGGMAWVCTDRVKSCEPSTSGTCCLMP